MQLTLEQMGVLVGMIVGGISGSWTIFQIFQARKRERDALHISIAEKEHRLTQIESSLDAHEDMLNLHEAKIQRLLEFK